MERNLPIIIEERNMPIDNYKLENKSAGFSNVVFLGSMIATSIMWLIIIYICR